MPAGQVDDPAPRPHDDRQGQSSRAAGRPRPGVRQAQQGGGGGPLRRPDGQAHRRQPGRWWARTARSSRRTSTVGRSARRTGRRKFREEFQRRRGYDLLPFLPVMTGRVVDSLEVSERFLWDVRQTVSDLLLRELRRAFPRAGAPARAAAVDRGLRRLPVRRHDLRRPGRRADGRVLVVGQVSAARPTVAPRWPRRRTSTASRSSAPRRSPRPTRRSGWAIRRNIKDAGRLGVLRGHQPLRLPPLRPAAVDNPDRAPGMSHGAVGPALRADADLVGAVAGVARVPRPLPVPAAARAVRGRPLLPGAGELAAAVQVAA